MSNVISFICTVAFWYCVILIVCYIVSAISQTIGRNPIQKINFIEKAINEKTHTMGKVSCYTIKGFKKYQYVEYIYNVDGQAHYVTYRINIPNADYSGFNGEANAETLVNQFPSSTTIYYDKKNPDKCVTKREVFVSQESYTQTHTKKRNKYRDISKNWTEPIYL